MDIIMFKKIAKTLKIAAFPLAISLSAQAVADSSVWKVSKDDAHLYVGGTVHILPKDQFPLPVEFNKAYQASQSIVFEVTDLNPESQEFQQKLMAQMMYTDGRTLQSVLSVDTYNRLSKVCEQYGIPLANMNMFKPSMISIMLTMAEFTKLGVAGDGVDKFFEDKAKSDNKSRLGLETIDYQIGVLSGMGDGVEDEFISKTLDDLPQTKAMFKNMVTSWRDGDMAKMDAIMGQAMKGYSAELYHNLLVQRNNNWVPKIEKMLDTKEIEFVLVGAAHLAGEDSVLSQLASKGYTIKKL